MLGAGPSTLARAMPLAVSPAARHRVVASEAGGVDLIADEEDEEEEREDGRECRERGDAQRLAVLDAVSRVCDQLTHPPVA